LANIAGYRVTYSIIWS